jgi:hypothetical protein
MISTRIGSPASSGGAFRLRALWFAAALGLFAVLLSSRAPQAAAFAQTAPASRQIGTVKEVVPGRLTITTDAGAKISVNVADGAKVLQIAPGSTDLKAAQTIALGDIEPGDRVLVSGHQDAPDALTASRVILMKSTDISKKREAEEEDWQKRGSGGLVSAIDPPTGNISLSARGKKITIETTPATIYRRYAAGSVKYEDAKPGTLAEIKPGDQLRVRGAKSEDGNSIKAEEIVSGSFKNLAGTIASLDAAAGTLTLKDLATKKTYIIKVTANSNVRELPAEAAARFAARARASQAAAPPAATPASATATEQPHAASAGGDLSQLISRLPQGSLGQLHVGDAVMVVASQAASGEIGLTAVTLLSGVEPILAATPKGEASMTLSPWNFGGGADGGGM